ncbi:MAG: peptidoglycan DD-metalloendopeptidase family protein [Deltaproteobacteria bacterium]|nr:peptidoglycan DD-metalloendopeptidase family protein [Deltaproteobacteria bacterium]MDH3383018.1 peptidoglycan DD-metalloendopeptidase family protein [Deltaproteobacteria bacterium]
MNKRLVIAPALAVLVLFSLFKFFHRPQELPGHTQTETTGESSREIQDVMTSGESSREIRDVVKPGETMFDIFKKYGLNFQELFHLKEASAGVHRLGRITTGKPYRIELGPDNSVLSLTYQINDDVLLNITRADPGFRAEKITIPYETKTSKIGGTIEGNLYDALGNGGESALLAYALSDIFSWDIDFTTDLRTGDTFKVVVEEQWMDGRFKRYGSILAAEFTNDGKAYRAFRYEGPDGRAGYYDEAGKSLQRSFLKAPLSYRRISSGFTNSRRHPILKIRRPHRGVDYVASRGTPVSALGDGSVQFAGYKGANGNLVILRHPKGFTTYYGHLHKIRKGIRRGARVAQGDVIGYVGSTGRTTGPHLHFQMKKGNRIINPLRVDVPRSVGIPKNLLADYDKIRQERGHDLASIVPSPQKSEPESKTQTLASRR